MTSDSYTRDRNAQWSFLASQLGYEQSTKLLIIHADDLGMATSVNKATFDALKQRAISSASVMVPCPWFPEVVAYALNHPGTDLGVHLTLTSEWDHYRWRPLESVSRTQSIVDPEGYFWKTETDIATNASPEAVRLEVEAQIERALRNGIDVTHLDSHMFTLVSTPSLLQVFAQAAYKYRLPLRLTRAAIFPINLPLLPVPLGVPLDGCFQIKEEVDPADWYAYYRRIIEVLQPGIHELIVHLAYDCDELRAMIGSNVPWGSQWRQRDLDVITSLEFKRLLEQHDIRVITWRDLNRLAWPELMTSYSVE